MNETEPKSTDPDTKSRLAAIEILERLGYRGRMTQAQIAIVKSVIDRL